MIFTDCETDSRAKEWEKKLPGPYTIILKVKNKFFADNVNNKSGTIGVRVPNNWFYNVIKQMKVPVVTTSANLIGQDFMTCLDDLDENIKKKVDFIVYDGPLKSRPSTIVHLETPDVEIKKR